MSDKPRLRVLFIGNSLTFWAGGLDGVFRRWNFDAHAETVGGATLLTLWNGRKALRRIQEGDWDVVVLQDDLPEYPVARRKGTCRWKDCVAPFSEAATK